MSNTTVETTITRLTQFNQIATPTSKQVSMYQSETQINVVIEKINEDWQVSTKWQILQSDSLPQEFSGLVTPDIVAQFKEGNLLAIGQVETAFTMFTHDALTRWSKFGDIAPVRFYIYVPKGYEKPCRYLLNQNDISATLVTYSFDEYLNPLLEPSLY